MGIGRPREAVTPMPRLDPHPFGSWPNCLRLSDGRTELVVTTDVGPRVVRYAFVNGPNLLKEFPSQFGLTGGADWRIYGGHRFWTAPEDVRTTYVPDNNPVAWAWNGRELTLRQAVDPRTKLEKSIALACQPDGSVRLRHRITNRGRRAVTLAPWALTVMAPGGEAVLPHEPKKSHKTHKLPARPLILWPYADMSDTRYTWGRDAIRVKQDPARRTAQKIGVFSTVGWMAYLWKGHAFIKRHSAESGRHPDMGCNVELFVNGDILELETLGPLTILSPGRSVTHDEAWSLHRAPRSTPLRTLAAL